MTLIAMARFFSGLLGLGQARALAIRLRRIDGKIHPADATDHVVAMLRLGAAQRDVGVPPCQVGEIENGWLLSSEMPGQSRRKSGSRGAIR